MNGWTFVSAGWPYLYEVPGLHNCIPMLFADAVARFLRGRGENVLYVSGADEHGSRVEFVAEGLGMSPRDLVDAKVALTRPLLAELGLSLDLFARTSDADHQVYVARLIQRLVARGAAVARTDRVPYCAGCDRYLPDRFAEGTCPRCRGPAFGNQCNDKRQCGAILDAFQLVDGRCAVCASPYEPREREHLWVPLDRWRDRLRDHIEASHAHAPGVLARARATLDATDGVVLTRDTAWGIPLGGALHVPGRSVYSWVDSLLGKLSAVAALGREHEVWRTPGAKRVFFMGSDSVGFYAVLMPVLLMAAEEDLAVDEWRIVTNDVLIYEGGVCSKSSRNGIALPEALALLPADYWRFVIFEAEARAARSGRVAGSVDMDFRWDDFARTASRVLGAIDRLYVGLAGAHVASPRDVPALAPVRAALADHQPGLAFSELLDLLQAPETARRPQDAAAALPLLSCFLPDAAARAREILAGRHEGPVFPHLPLDGAQLRAAYGRKVAERRAAMDLAAELTDVRADLLCVCPARLDEA